MLICGGRALSIMARMDCGVDQVQPFNVCLRELRLLEKWLPLATQSGVDKGNVIFKLACN
jgi:hypothetical protein